MKRIFSGILILSLFLIAACGQQILTEEEAITKLKAAGCFYDLTQEGECIRYEAPYWIAMKEGCGGECILNANTGEIQIDENPMCLGLLLEGECETDDDCKDRTIKCARGYKCQDTTCIPYY